MKYLKQSENTCTQGHKAVWLPHKEVLGGRKVNQAPHQQGVIAVSASVNYTSILGVFLFILMKLMHHRTS